METNNIIQKYIGKILGIRLYKAEEQKYFVEDFKNIKILQEYLNEVCNSESDLTPIGKRFLEEYYGLDKLGKLLADHGGIDDGTISSADEIVKRISNIIPLDTHDFINEDSKRDSRM